MTNYKIDLEKLKKEISNIGQQYENCLENTNSDVGISQFEMCFNASAIEEQKTSCIKSFFSPIPFDNTKFTYCFDFLNKPQIFNQLESDNWIVITRRIGCANSIENMLLFNKQFNILTTIVPNSKAFNIKFIGLTSDVGEFIAAKEDKKLFNLLKANIKRIREKSEKFDYARCYIIGRGMMGLELIPLNGYSSKANSELIKKSYPTINHKKINDFFNEEIAGKGKLVLFHGKPGTGKTSYIRYVLSTVYNGDVVFMNSDIFADLSSVSFATFALSNLQGKVLVIEDAESLLVSRGDKTNAGSVKDRTTSIADLLNFTDGLIGDALNVKVVASFNTEIKDIDPALLRKGRLFCKEEFGELNKEQTKELIDFLAVDTFKKYKDYKIENVILPKDKETYSLADIYGAVSDLEEKLKESTKVP